MGHTVIRSRASRITTLGRFVFMENLVCCIDSRISDHFGWMIPVLHAMGSKAHV